jgi:formate transporter
MATEIQIDALPPAKMAAKMEDVGVAKAKMKFGYACSPWPFWPEPLSAPGRSLPPPFWRASAAGVGYGIQRLLGGLVFCLGLIAVVVAGAELFTGNNLIIMAFARAAGSRWPAAAQLGDRVHRQLCRLDR